MDRGFSGGDIEHESFFPVRGEMGALTNSASDMLFRSLPKNGSCCLRFVACTQRVFFGAPGTASMAIPHSRTLNLGMPGTVRYGSHLAQAQSGIAPKLATILPLRLW